MSVTKMSTNQALLRNCFPCPGRVLPSPGRYGRGPQLLVGETLVLGDSLISIVVVVLCASHEGCGSGSN